MQAPVGESTDAGVQSRLNSFDSRADDTYYTRPMSAGWSSLCDAEALADRGAEEVFSIPLEALPRLAALLADVAGEASGRVRFAKQRGLAVADLEVEATLALACQRCLGTVRIAVAGGASIAIVADTDAAEQVPPELEAVVARGGRIAIRDLADEELLLLLPLVPLHPRVEECRIEQAAAGGAERAGQTPFAELATLFGSGRAKRPEE